MQCMRLIGHIFWPRFRHRCIIPHYSLTNSLAASLPPSLPLSIPAFICPSFPPSLFRWPLPARLSQGKLPQLRNAVLLHCKAPLCSASLRPCSTHIWTRKYAHIFHSVSASHASTHSQPCTQNHPQIHTKTALPHSHLYHCPFKSHCIQFFSIVPPP